MAAKGTLRVRVVGDTTDLKRKLSGAGGMVGKFALGAAAAVAGAAVFSVKKFADFDQAMTNSVAIMGDVSDAMRKDMSDAAREVAKTTKFSAVEAAESFFFLASAGLDAEQSIAALPRVARFAQAGNFDMARATDLLTDAQSALGLASNDAAENLTNMTRVSDVLVKANTLANASVEQFSESLTEKAGAALRTMNKDVEEGVAVLAVFADQGIKGSRAGTTLTRTLEGLAENSRKNADAFERLGVRVFDADGEMRNMADIVGDLEGAFEGMSVQQIEAELAQLGFNRQARAGILALLGNSEALAEYEESLRDAGGTTEDVADKQMQTLWAQLGLLKDQFIDLALSIGEFLMPKLMNIVEWAQEQMPKIEQFIKDGLASIEQFWRDHGDTVIEFVQNAWDTISETAEGAFETLGQIWRGGQAALEGDWAEFWSEITGGAESGFETLDELLVGHDREAQIKWNSSWSDIQGLNESGWDVIKREFRKAGGDVEGILSSATPKWSRVVARGFIDLRSRAREQWIKFTLWLSKQPDRVAGFFRRLPGQLSRIGRDIVSGLWNGFRARWGQFTSWVSNLPGAGIVKNLARALGIRSPSTVMAKEIGGPIVEGIEMGMRSQFGSLERTMADVPALLAAADVEARSSLSTLTGVDAAGGAPRAATNGPLEVRLVVDITGGDREMRNMIRGWMRKDNLISGARK